MANPEACAPNTSSHETIAAPTIRLTDLFDGFPLDPELLTQNRMERLVQSLDGVATDALIESPDKVEVGEIDERYDEAILHAALAENGIIGLARLALSPFTPESIRKHTVGPDFGATILNVLNEESTKFSNPEQHIQLAQPEADLGHPQQVRVIDGHGYDAMLAAHNAMQERLAPLLEHVNTPQVSRCLQ